MTGLLSSVALANDDFIIRPFTSTGSLSLNLIPTVGANGVSSIAKTQSYQPNVTNLSGVVVGHKEFSLTWGSTLPESDASIRERGETRYRDYQLQLYYTHYGIDLFYQTYKGFYRSSAMDSEKTSLADGTKAFPQLPDMEMKKYGANIFYVFTPENYSISAAFSQTSRQTRSGGSWIIMGMANDVSISNKGSPILPSEQRSEFGVNGNISGARLKSIGGLVGGGYTYCLGGWYLSMQGLGGVAAQQFKGTGLQTSGTQNIASTLYNIRGSMGYNGSTFFAGLMWLTDQITTKIDGLQIQPVSQRVELFMGARFYSVI